MSSTQVLTSEYDKYNPEDHDKYNSKYDFTSKKYQHVISTHVYPFCAPLLFLGGRKLVIFLADTSPRTEQGVVYTM